MCSAALELLALRLNLMRGEVAPRNQRIKLRPFAAVWISERSASGRGRDVYTTSSRILEADLWSVLDEHRHR